MSLWLTVSFHLILLFLLACYPMISLALRVLIYGAPRGSDSSGVVAVGGGVGVRVLLIALLLALISEPVVLFLLIFGWLQRNSARR
jgi:hypothetical protein